MITYIKLIFWVILTLGVLNMAFNFINASDNILNIIGLLIIAMWAGISAFTYLFLEK